MTPQLAVSKELLLTVRKPARYIGGEVGCANKDFSAAAVKVCLAFPDVYDVGMSHLGLRILYDVINRNPSWACDRVFSPWVDMEDLLKSRGLLLFGLDSQRPVKEFDILAFSIPYELTYTNVLNILALSGMPLKSLERDDQWPLVIAGGTTCLNPEPLSDFIDLFLIGEGEEAIVEILGVYQSCRQRGLDKKRMLKELSRIEGVYVPSFYEGVAEDGMLRPIDKDAPRKIKKRIVRDLETVMDFSSWIVPYIEIVHDRISLEIMRGCPHGCRFCQAYASFYPLRVVRKEKILSLARRLYRMTGYEEISLLSLSSSDHPELKEIVLELVDEFKEHGVGISLPSIRATSQVGELSHVFSTMRKTTLTFAPEAGSQRLRDLLGKTLDTRDIFDAARQAYLAGYRSLKLYFMIGLPTETEEDLKEIISFCAALSSLKKEVGGHPARLNVTLSNFVPKPHTPLEKAGMCPVEELEAKQAFLRNALKKKGLIQLKFHDARMSGVEAVLARGGRECGRIVAAAQAAGARFDAWNDQFQPLLWKDVLDREGADPDRMGGIQKDRGVAPWVFIETGARRG